MADESDKRHEKVKEIFEEATRRNTIGERDAYVDEECGDDAELRGALEALLKEHDEGGEGETLVGMPENPGGAGTTFEPGRVLAERYRIVTLLGKGGMGEVYRVDDLKLGQPVALKFLPKALGQDAARLEALYNEVRQARKVAHRNVCRVYDVGEAEGLHFLTMEYIEGEDLSSLLRRIGRLPRDKAVALGRQLCAGLEAAHDEGLLHLDLKPANLMIDERGDLRVTDFGLARLAEDAASEVRRAGTPIYMAPEQLLEGSASERSDLFAVGLILFEMFNGRRMHGGRTMKEVVDWHLGGGSTTLSPDAVNALEPEVRDLILGCTAQAPEGRPESVKAVSATLEMLAQSPATQAGPPEGEEDPVTQSAEELKGSDVYISYAPVDDKPLAVGKPGWIAQFQDHLQVRLEQLSGENVRIWRDLRSQADEAGERLEYLPTAKTMVSVLSPPFVKAPACLRDVETFWQTAERSGTFRVSDKTRILKVMKTPVPSGVAPPDVERLMDQLAGFEFYETDPESGRVMAYDETFGEKAMQRYYERVYDIAYEIRDVLQALVSGGGGPAGEDGKTVYLAESTTDLQAERDALKRELLENGHRVVPELPLSFSGVEIEKEVRLLLEEADFAVHLVGARYGMVPEDMQESVVELQNRLAAERSAASGLARLMWMPRGVEPRDERQAGFVRALTEDPGAHRGGEVVQDSMENFKQMLLDALNPPEGPDESLPVRQAGEGVSSIYLIYDRRDEEAVEPLEDLLFELGYEVTTPSFEGDETEVSKFHQHNLQHCDGVLIYYGKVSKPWVEMKLMDVAQAPGYGRTKELLAKAVLVAPSDDRRKARFRTHLAEVIRPETSGVDREVLEQFTALMQEEAAS